MEAQDQTPTSPFLIVDGVPAGQTPYIQEPFKSILPLFDQIIEIGFDRAGLSLWLYQNKNPNASLHCYDISFGAKEVNNPNINFKQGNCFDPTIIQEIAALIQRPGRTLLLCDGGSKESEFKVYSAFLKPNDVIMLHDYAHTDEDFNLHREKTKWIAGPESRYANIKSSIDTQTLTGFHYDTFKAVFWGSFIKSVPTIPTLA